MIMTKIIKRYNNIMAVNALDYGIRPGMDHDQTSLIQAAINELLSVNGSCHDLVFPNGTYMIAGALQTNVRGQNPNCQIYIPTCEIYPNTKYGKIRLIGESNFIMRSAYTDFNVPIKNTGVIFRSTIAGSGATPSIIGGKGIDNNVANLILNSIEIENISFEAYTAKGTQPPSLLGVNGRYFNDFNVKNCSFGIDVMIGASSDPSNTETCALFCGPIGNTGPNKIEKCLVYGYKYGFVGAEHTILENTYAFGCVYAYVIPDLYYTLYGVGLLAHGCKHTFLFPNSNFLGADWINSSLLKPAIICSIDIEAVTGLSGWHNYVDDIVDAGNKAIGRITYNKRRSIDGVRQALAVASGGTHLTLLDLNE